MKLEIKDIKELFKCRDKDANKYDFGVVGLMGGSLEFSGAIKLANLSLSALRSGSGLVRVIVEENLKDAILPYLLEQTLFILDNNLNKALNNLDVLAVGMGWGQDESRTQYLEYILKNFTGKLIIDADGLNILAKNLNWLEKTKAKIVLTPHLKEFSRLTGLTVEKIKEHSLEYAQDFARKHNIILLLKGSSTIVTDGVTTYLVESGSPEIGRAHV